MKSLPTCQNCYKHWSWKQTFKSSSNLDIGMKCPFCNTKQYPTAKTSKRTFLLSVITLLPMILPFFNISPVIPFISIFVLGALFILIHPFYTEVSNEETTLASK
ncbi:TIGR04104 family putative zinc finger protein [Salipaludibacillus daqingensis]|uniref:TIGR04104 family putative zinc finger protein n=1 Tax=Salipaludibacillus daqingensis TaxID=3041001 RepID=UPI002473EFF3|nr:TIGR04104 family putative zinc finger protein [Salipaludibacillus daqingensis]